MIFFYLLQVSVIENENGKPKYKSLYALIKCCLVLSNGNSEPEHRYSINEHRISIH